MESFNKYRRRHTLVEANDLIILDALLLLFYTVIKNIGGQEDTLFIRIVRV